MKEEKHRIHNNEGLNIAVVVNNPEINSQKLAILCPGFLDSKDYLHLQDLAMQLSENGYTVYRLDPIGTWESEGDISQYCVTEYLKNLKSVIDFALTKSSFQEILIGGHSRGGQVSLLYGLRDERVTKVLAIMPSSGARLDTQRYLDWKTAGFATSFRDLPLNKEEKREYKVPYSHVEDMQRCNIKEEIQNLEIPKIFVLGEANTMCTPESVENLYNLAIEPKKLIRLAGAEHDYRKRTDCHEINKLIIENLE